MNLPNDSMIPTNFVYCYQYFVYQNFNREQSQSALSCHHVIFEKVNTVSSCPVAKETWPFFCMRQSIFNELLQEWHALLGV